MTGISDSQCLQLTGHNSRKSSLYQSSSHKLPAAQKAQCSLVSLQIGIGLVVVAMELKGPRVTEPKIPAKQKNVKLKNAKQKQFKIFILNQNFWCEFWEKSKLKFLWSKAYDSSHKLKSSIKFTNSIKVFLKTRTITWIDLKLSMKT